MDSLENYRILLSVADLGGFSAAAKALSLTTAKVSRAVAELEQDVGITLLERTTRRVTVTPAGKELIAKVRPAVTVLTDASRAASAPDSGIYFNSLRVACCRAGGLGLVAPALPGFAAAHRAAGITLDLHDRPVHPDNEGYDLALAIAATPDGGHDRGQSLMPVELAIVASPTYCAMHKRPQAPSELLQHRLLVWSGMPTWEMRGGTILKPEGAVISNDLSVLQKCCIAANGIALLPMFMVSEQLRDRTLTLLLDGFEPKPLQLTAQWGNRTEPCAAAKGFLEHLTRHFRSHLT